MISFSSDYICGAHPAILAKLAEVNYVSQPGYGTDGFCASAAEKIKAACNAPEAQVTFLVGGTQTNQLVISTMLKPYEGVVAAATGHIATHEAGAIEYSGHKVLAIPGVDGKLAAADLEAYLAGFYADGNHEHMVFPGMVYISFPTEYGTLYSKAELTALHEVCRRYDIPLYVDGARLAYGLAGMGNDVTLADLAALTDVFYIGATKCGALFGEALVFTHGNMPAHFMTQTKQHGALLAKGWLTGLQFDVLFTDDLYLKIGEGAIAKAKALRAMLEERGYQIFLDSPTNQQFVVLPNDKYAALSEQVSMSFWEAYDADRTVVRFATSWSTSDEDMAALAEIL